MLGGLPFFGQQHGLGGGMGGTTPGPSGGSPIGNQGSYVMAPGGGIDMMATFRKMNFQNTHYASPGSD